MLTLRMSLHWFARRAVQLECVLTEEDSPQVLMLLETLEELPSIQNQCEKYCTAALETKVFLLSGI